MAFINLTGTNGIPGIQPNEDIIVDWSVNQEEIDTYESFKLSLVTGSSFLKLETLEGFSGTKEYAGALVDDEGRYVVTILGVRDGQGNQALINEEFFVEAVEDNFDPEIGFEYFSGNSTFRVSDTEEVPVLRLFDRISGNFEVDGDGNPLDWYLEGTLSAGFVLRDDIVYALPGINPGDRGLRVVSTEQDGPGFSAFNFSLEGLPPDNFDPEPIYDGSSEADAAFSGDDRVIGNIFDANSGDYSIDGDGADVTYTYTPSQPEAIYVDETGDVYLKAEYTRIPGIYTLGVSAAEADGDGVSEITVEYTVNEVFDTGTRQINTLWEAIDENDYPVFGSGLSSIPENASEFRSYIFGFGDPDGETTATATSLRFYDGDELFYETSFTGLSLWITDTEASQRMVEAGEDARFEIEYIDAKGFTNVVEDRWDSSEVEVPVEVIKEIEKIVEVEKIVEKTVEVDNPEPVYINGGRFKGSSKSDIIFGSKLHERLFGRGGDDILVGKGGIDKLVGGIGDDILRGGRGPDKFRPGSGDDIIADFKIANDKLLGRYEDPMLSSVEGGTLMEYSEGSVLFKDLVVAEVESLI